MLSQGEDSMNGKDYNTEYPSYPSHPKSWKQNKAELTFKQHKQNSAPAKNNSQAPDKIYYDSHPSVLSNIWQTFNKNLDSALIIHKHN